MVTMEKIVGLAKSRGFVYPGSEIYGGLANTWDYGPLGVELKNNIKAAWWQKFVRENKYNVGVDSSILMNQKVWITSGHVGGFSDPLMDCKNCKERFRADKIIEEYNQEKNTPMVVDGWAKDRMRAYIEENNIACPSCGGTDFTDIREFNLMFKTSQGVTESSQNTVYLRPETAQGIFINFKNVQRTSRKKIPFGICQIGKAFRNEITPGNFIFRTREFEQMELEFFCHPSEDKKWFDYWKDFCLNWLTEFGMKKENIKLRDHSPDELSHYSAETADIEYKFPFGYGELWGIANRTNFDLKSHTEQSDDELIYFDPDTEEKFIPYCIEPSVGVDRAALAFLCDAYREEEISPGDIRVVLGLHSALAPVKIAVLPLSKKLAPKAEELYSKLTKHFACQYDDTGSIGKRYRRQDEIGTPFCITFDFESLEDNAVTIRHRDSMEQERIAIDDLLPWFFEKI